MEACGTVTPGGHSSLPKQAWGGLCQRPDAEVARAVDPFAVEVVAARIRLERQTERVDEELAARGRIRRHDRDAGDEEDIHG